MRPWLLAALVSSLLRLTAADLSFARLGPFGVNWDAEEPFIVITSPEGRVLFRTLRHWPFLTVGYASSSRPPIESGNFKINEWVLYETPYRESHVSPSSLLTPTPCRVDQVGHHPRREHRLPGRALGPRHPGSVLTGLLCRT